METSDSGVRWSHGRPSRQLQLLETKSFGDQRAAPGHVALQTFWGRTVVCTGPVLLGEEGSSCTGCQTQSKALCPR